MNLDDWRSRINDLDNRILQLLNQRAEAANQIGDLKRRQDTPSYAPEREAEIFRRLTESRDGLLGAEAIGAIWREILSACRALEAALTISYFGPPATFTHQAALQRFGLSVTYRPAKTIAEVFDDVEHKRADFGVVPVENNTEGAVNVTLDRLIDSDVLICGELRLEITQNLLSRATGLDGIKRVLSHPQGLAQCRGWLAQHLPAVEDNPHNSTRFLVVGRHPSGPTGRDKTSILFAMRNEPGTLYRILEPLARLGINLTKIESRPAKGRPWEYVIFVDLEGHRDTSPVSSVLREIGERTLFLKVLGSYPAL